MNKKAQEQIVVTILLILMVMAAIVIVWFVFNKFMEDYREKVKLKEQCTAVSLEFERESIICNVNEQEVSATIKRGGDDVGNIKMKIIVSKNTKQFTAPNSTGVTSVKMDVFPVVNDGEQIAIKVAPIVGDKDISVVCNPSDKTEVLCLYYPNIKIESVFDDNEIIPTQYTCDGVNINPPLEIKYIPNGAKTLAIIVDDPDAPTATGPWVHWVVWNISVSGNALSIVEGTNIGINGTNDFGSLVYRGPCPPSGTTHHYYLKVYALDTELTLAQGSTKQQLEQAMKGHIIEKDELIGIYTR